MAPHEHAAVVVTRERVTAPPDRFIDVQDADLLAYFQGAFPASAAPDLARLQDMLEGLCQAQFGRVRRALQSDFAYFAAAAAGAPPPGAARAPPPSPADLDKQEERFVGALRTLLEAGQYRLISAPEWAAAQAEEFLLTLPVGVDWRAMDDTLLPRVLSRADAARLPKDTAARCLVFARGVGVARLRGRFIAVKIDLLLKFLVIAPVLRFLWAIGSVLGASGRRLRAAPSQYGAPDTTPRGPKGSKAEGDGPAPPAEAQSHPHAVDVERRTFARVFPSAGAVLKKFLAPVDLQEASLKDVVILYRRATPAGPGAAAAETDLLPSAAAAADRAYLARNIVVRRFRDVPLADLEIVFPEKRVFMPPQALVAMAATAGGALAALGTALARGGADWRAYWAAATTLGAQAAGLYSQARTQQTAVDRAMTRLAAERALGAQEAALSSLVEEMAAQRARELFVAYAAAAGAAGVGAPSAAALDARCEALLAREFGLRLDFTAESALPSLLAWGLLRAAPGGGLDAAPLPEALAALDRVWDGLHDFSAAAAAPAAGAAALLGRVASAAAGSAAGAPPPAPSKATAESVMGAPPPARGKGLFGLGKSK